MSELCPICSNNLTDAQYLILNNVLYKSCPRCSQDENMHINYFCPENFVVTEKRISRNSPIGIQSLCAKCRGSKKGPHEGALTCAEAKQQGGHIISEIRLLPMSTQVFNSMDEVSEFLLHDMPLRGGTYYYKTSKMVIEKDTFVLFQYAGLLVGSAICICNVDLPEDFSLDGESYNGYYQFDISTIVLFDNPITKEQFKTIDFDFKGFNQSHQKKPVGLLPSIFKLNYGSYEAKILDEDNYEEITISEVANVKEGAKKQIIVNAYERNPVAKRECLKYYKIKNDGVLKCEICGFSFAQKYGMQFKEKIHVHHIIEISSIGEEYEINPIKDLIPVCPNCHMIIHSRKPAYTPDEVKKLISDEE